MLYDIQLWNRHNIYNRIEAAKIADMIRAVTVAFTLFIKNVCNSGYMIKLPVLHKNTAIG